MRKKKARAIGRNEALPQYSTTENQSQEAIEVNWDEIERQYTEMPTPHKHNETCHNSSSAHIHSSPATENEDCLTAVSGNADSYNASPAPPAPPAKHSSKPDTHRSPVIPNIAEPMSTNTFDEVRHLYITKPDGGSS